MTSSKLEARMLDDLINLFKQMPILEIPSTPFLSQFPSPADEIKHHRKEISQLLSCPSKGIHADIAHTLRYSLEIAALTGYATNEQLDILCGMCDVLQEYQIKAIVPLTDSVPWLSAITAMKRIRQLSNTPGMFQSPRASAVANSIRRLESKGYKIEISAFGPVLESASLQKICEEVDKGIKRIGGRWVIENILSWFSKNDRMYQGTFLHGRNTTQLPSLRNPSIPWHYLYNLAWKHFDAQPSARDISHEFIDVLDLASDMAAVFDTEAYSSFEEIGISAINLHSCLLDKIFYDELFAFPQWLPKTSHHLISSWLKHLQDQGCVLPLSGTLTEWSDFCLSILSSAKPTSIFITAPCEHTHQTLDLKKSEVFFKALCIASSEINRDYMTPFDTDKRNTPYYPFFEWSTGLYVLPPQAILGRALYEGIYRLLRDTKTPNLEKMMGTALENIAAEALLLTGNKSVLAGVKYNIPNQPKGVSPYEMDVVAETPTHIFLVECKKKPLTNAARKGDSLKALVDFSKAFLFPLNQANGHEIQIRSNGISLLGGGQLHLNNRDIRRISITMTDHGSMQYRVFVRNVVSALWGHKLTSTNPKLQKEADEFNKELDKIVKSVTELAQLANVPLDKFVFHYLLSSWWLSIDQLYFFCTQTDAIDKALCPLPNTTFGSGDLMTEIYYCQKRGLLKTS
jgi:hypothetical protein